MVRRMAQESRTGPLMLPPGLSAAPVLDLMCTHFVLTLAQQQGAQFNVRRDLAQVVTLGAPAHERLIHPSARLFGHAERAVAQPRGDVFRGRAEARP